MLSNKLNQLTRSDSTLGEMIEYINDRLATLWRNENSCVLFVPEAQKPDGRFDRNVLLDLAQDGNKSARQIFANMTIAYSWTLTDLIARMRASDLPPGIIDAADTARRLHSDLSTQTRFESDYDFKRTCELYDICQILMSNLRGCSNSLPVGDFAPPAEPTPIIPKEPVVDQAEPEYDAEAHALRYLEQMVPLTVKCILEGVNSHPDLRTQPKAQAVLLRQCVEVETKLEEAKKTRRFDALQNEFHYLTKAWDYLIHGGQFEKLNRVAFDNDVDYFFYETYNRILNEGVLKDDRTGVGTKAVVGVMGRFNISQGRPALTTTKEVITRSAYREMIDLFVAGTSSIKKLRDHKIGIWDDWAIPGTQVFDEPREPYLLEYRTQLAREAGLEEELFHWLDGSKVGQSLVREENVRGNYELINVDLIPTYTSTWDLFASEVKQVHDWLTKKGIPTHRIPGGKPVSIQKRLSRVSKNDTEKWEVINKASIPDPMVDWDGETYKVTVFKDGKFQDITLDYGQYINVNAALDKLGVNAYPLIDADIGEGCYGRQWRHWQDTQLCGESSEEYNAYIEQGYECVGTFKNSHNNSLTCVMHREIDQLQNVIKTLMVKPDDRRMIVTAWNPGRVWQAALPACHFVYQFVSHVMTLEERWTWHEWDFNETVKLNDAYMAENPDGLFVNPEPIDRSLFVTEEDQHAALDDLGVPRRKLYCQFNMRSWDVALGASFNIAQYALLTHMVAHVTGHATAELIVSAADAHLYLNTIDGIKEQLTRSSAVNSDARIRFARKIENIDDFTYEDIILENYNPHDRIVMPVAV